MENAQVAATDAEDDNIAAEWVGDKEHRVMVVYRNTIGEITRRYSSANGLPPYTDPA
jgi:hypothetical protein